MVAKVKVMLMNIGVDQTVPFVTGNSALAGVNIPPEALRSGVVTVTTPETTTKTPQLVAAFRTVDGRQVDFNLPVSSASGLTPGEVYHLELHKVTDKS